MEIGHSTIMHTHVKNSHRSPTFAKWFHDALTLKIAPLCARTNIYATYSL